MSGGKAIPEGADLKSDTYKIPGNYYCGSNKIIGGLINCPVSSAFILKVEYSTGVENPRQTFKEYNTGKIVSRLFDEYTQKWIADVSYITNSDISVASSPHIEIRMEDSVQGRRLVITDPGQNKWYGNILMDMTGDGTLP